MIFELEKSRYGRLSQLFKRFGIEDYNVLAAILEGNNRAKVFADDVEAPNTALVWAINCMFYFVGDHDNPRFNDYFPDTLNRVIAPESLRMGANAFVCALLHGEGWNERVETYFAGRKTEIGYRQEFSFNKERYDKRPKTMIPDNCRMERINMDLLMSDKKGLLRDNICEFWYSAEDFMEKGAGFCLLKDGQVVSSCFSCYSSVKGMDINIDTYGIENRNRGYAALTASAFIDDCISNGLSFGWEAYENNLASIAVAEKLGFEKSKKYLCYEFSLSE